MEPIYVGWLSILPPVIAITLALITKEVISSLMIGILSGTLIYAVSTGLNPIVAGSCSGVISCRVTEKVLLIVKVLE